MSRGGRPIGAAKGKQSDTEGLCQPPPPVPKNRCEQQPPPGHTGLFVTPFFFHRTGFLLYTEHHER